MSMVYSIGERLRKCYKKVIYFRTFFTRYLRYHEPVEKNILCNDGGIVCKIGIERALIKAAIN